MATSRDLSTSFPTLDQFAEVLSQAPSWYTVSTFLGAPITDLDMIRDQCSKAPDSTLMCLIEVYKCMEKKGKLLSWESIATALKRMENHGLAEKIHKQYMKPSMEQERDSTNNETAQSSSSPSPLSTVSPTALTNNQTTLQYRSPTTDVTVETSVPHKPLQCVTDMPTFEQHKPIPVESIDKPHPLILSEEHKPVCMIAEEYNTLSIRFDTIMLKIKRAIKKKYIDEIQDVLRRQCGLPKLSQEDATVDAVLARVEEQCSILNFSVMEFIVKNVLKQGILNQGRTFLKQLTALKQSVEEFKLSANMVELVTLIKNKQTTPTRGQKIVELKLREFWNDFTYKQFEVIINEIFQTLYDKMTNITVSKGCICLNWIIPDIDTTKLLPQLPLEFVRLVGVIYLHIGNEVIYNIEGDGCEMIEAAMLQAIELKNTRAIELLLAVGCSPQVATYNDSNTVTNIVNIRAIESKESSSDGSSGGVNHVCILGHNEHVEAIVDSNREPECSSCTVKEKMNICLHQENARLRNDIKVHMQKIEELASEVELLKEKPAKKMKLKAIDPPISESDSLSSSDNEGEGEWRKQQTKAEKMHEQIALLRREKDTKAERRRLISDSQSHISKLDPHEESCCCDQCSRQRSNSDPGLSSPPYESSN